jgi:small multidrug resistance pump
MTKLYSYIFLYVAILIGIAGQLLLKSGALASNNIKNLIVQPFVLYGMVAYGLGAMFYIVSLRQIPISIAFPSVSLSYIVVAIFGHYFWAEPLGYQQVIAIILILLGVAILTNF